MSKEKMKVNISYKELIDLIETNGWTVDRKNKHIIYKHPTNPKHIVLSKGKGGGNPSMGVVRKIRNIIENRYYGQNEKYVIS